MFERIPLQEFRARTGIKKDTPEAEPAFVVALRDLVRVSQVLMMSNEYLRKILDTICLEGCRDSFPYRGREFHVATFDPSAVKRAQTFALQSKIIGLVRDINSLIGNHASPSGFAKLTPLIIRGYDASGSYVEAHYLPAIVEEHAEHQAVLLDGTHRCLLTETVGNGMMGIFIRKVNTPLPCTPVLAKEVKLVEVKPPRDERFLNLNTTYFRNLNYAGVDG